MRILAWILVLGVITPVAVLAKVDEVKREQVLERGEERVEARMERQEERQEKREERKEARGILREARHADRLARVAGIMRGMVNKLDNLSQQLSNHVQAVNKRIAALIDAGHAITVDPELVAYENAVTAVQTHIEDIKEALAALPDSETPRDQMATIRELVRSLRPELAQVREAFKALKDAIKEDIVVTSVSPSPTVTP